MALASIFAACTQDEFETVNGADALAGRKSIGKVTFTEAPSTRWNVDNFNSILPEAGDGYSLLLVDVPRQGLDGQHVYPIDNYELVSDVQTNYVFKTSDGVHFSNDAELVEGNYLFVAPAQEGKMDRKTVEITLPTEQNLSLDANGKLDPLSAIKEFAKSGHPFYIGHRFLSEGGKVSQPQMLNIFAFPEITIKNTVRATERTPILKQVILKRPKAEEPFVVNATLNTVAAAKALTNEYFDAAGEDTKNQVVVGDWAGHVTEYFGAEKKGVEDYKQGKNEDGTAKEIPSNVEYEVTYLNGDDTKYFMYNNGLNGATSDLISTPQSTSQYIIINMPGEGIALEQGEEITFNAIIPAGKYVLGGRYDAQTNNGGDLELYAVFGNDEAWQKVMSSNTNVTMYPGKRYPEQDYTGLKLNGEAGEYFTLNIDPYATDGQVGSVRVSAAAILGTLATVRTTEELLAFVQNTTSAEVLNVIVEGRNVVYNSEINNYLARTKCQDMNIQGYIKVEGTNDEENPLIVDPRVNMEQVVIEKGYVQAGAASLNNVFVAKGGALNLTETETGGTVINNAGTLTLSTTKFGEVKNYNVLKVNSVLNTRQLVVNIQNLYAACGEGGEIISPSINLKPSVEVMPKANYAVWGRLTYKVTVDAGKEADNGDCGTLTLLNDTRVMKQIEKFGVKEVEKIGNIINNGKVTGEHRLTVKTGRTMTIGKLAEVTSELVIEGASATLATLKATPDDEYIPAATVYNNGKLNDVTVDGLIVMGEGSRIDGTISASASTEGEIDNTNRGVIVNDPSTQGVEVYAWFNSLNISTEANLKAAEKEFNDYSGSYKVKVAKLKGELTVGNSDVTFGDGLTTSTINEIEFAEGSSLTIGDADFQLPKTMGASVSAKDVEWTGNSDSESTFNFNSNKRTSKLYLVYDKDTKMYSAIEGNIKFVNCQPFTWNNAGI